MVLSTELGTAETTPMAELSPTVMTAELEADVNVGYRQVTAVRMLMMVHDDVTDTAHVDRGNMCGGSDNIVVREVGVGNNRRYMLM